MPELPEVETTLRGLEPHLTGQTIARVVIRHARLRWEIPANLPTLLPQQRILNLQRRAKYLLLNCSQGTLLLHLGMSGSLRVLPANTPTEKHDHFEIILENGQMMRLRDPRRFGAVLWFEGDWQQHPLLAHLGPEPLDLPSLPNNCQYLDGSVLYEAIHTRKQPIKQCLMDNQIVVGVGNIYANEVLFCCRISPMLPAKQLTETQCQQLSAQIKTTLSNAIKLGGSSLRDFVHTDGKPGYFQQHYWVYGKAGEACQQCGTIIQTVKQGQRASFFCPQCQTL